MTFKPTEEQQAIIDAAASGAESVKVIAYAGTGKTTTLNLIAKALKNKHGLYAAFNRAIADEAGKKMPASVTAKTFHSLAFREFGAPIKHKLDMRLNGRVAAEMAGVPRMMSLIGTAAAIPQSIVGRALTATIDRFCGSMEEQIGEKHVVLPDLKGLGEHVKVDANMLKAEIVPYARKLWDKMLNDDNCPASHGVYVKLWAMSEPKIRADYILFDEAQDADPLMMHVINAQDAQKFWVGDPYQQIYSWRGAVNAMRRIEGQTHYLTQSFRFGAPVAAYASDVLQLLGENRPVRGNPCRQSTILTDGDELSSPSAILCRTNASVLKEVNTLIEQGRQVRSDGIDSIIRTVQSLRKLHDEGKGVNEFILFRDWDELLEYSDTPEGSDLKKFVKMINMMGFDDLLNMLDRIKANKQGVYVTTAHRSKGLEFPTVALADDFRLLKHDSETGLGLLKHDHDWETDRMIINPNEEELNLFYVAVTRGIEAVDVSAMHGDMLDAKEIHAAKHGARMLNTEQLDEALNDGVIARERGKRVATAMSAQG